MKASYQQGKLFLFYDSDAERQKLFEFVNIFMEAGRPAEIGLLQTTDDSLHWGVYLRALIDDNLKYINDITKTIKEAKKKLNET